jgi:hypothetical protein
MRARCYVGLLSFGVASIVNPGYFVGCAAPEDEDKFAYGAAEMTEFALAASDSYSFEQGGDEYRVDLDLEPQRAAAAHAELQPARGAGPFAATVHACGNRSLFSTASACIDSSSMPVAGTFSLLQVRNGTAELVASDIPVQGTLFVGSLRLNAGTINLAFDGGRLSLDGIYGESFKLSSYDVKSLLPAER